LYGDAHGAIDFLNRAYSQTSPVEVEELAWIANQIASIQIESGQNDAAAQTLEQAEQLFPHYPYTMENLARVRMARIEPAMRFNCGCRLRRSIKDPHVLYELAKRRRLQGSRKRAPRMRSSRSWPAPEAATDESRLDLILMYAGSPATAPNALKLAQQEIASRQDVWTLDAYAWALYANGSFRMRTPRCRRPSRLESRARRSSITPATLRRS
jgi:tetratricopeptide (TPR) repeat protein